MILESVVADNLIEILLSVVLAFNVGAYKLLWGKINDLEEEVEKNSESVDVVLKRIFGIDSDPTDEGHIMETEERISEINSKLENIFEAQKENRMERKEEHRKVDSKINSIIDILDRSEEFDINEEDFE